MQDWKIKHKNVTGHPLSAGLRRRPSSAAFCQLKGHVSSEGPAAAMEMLRCCRFEAVEQSASSSETN